MSESFIHSRETQETLKHDLHVCYSILLSCEYLYTYLCSIRKKITELLLTFSDADEEKSKIIINNIKLLLLQRKLVPEAENNDIINYLSIIKDDITSLSEMLTNVRNSITNINLTLDKVVDIIRSSAQPNKEQLDEIVLLFL